MRADRLLTIVLLLQRRRRLSGAEIAERLEVSERTILRDMEALGAAGIPVVSIRGPGGGFELVRGFRTDLTAFTDDESAALAVLGQPVAAKALGFESARLQLQLKLDLLLTASGKQAAADLSERFLNGEPEVDSVTARHIAFLRQSIARQRIVVAREAGTEPRELAPLGIVLHRGDWFLVAQAGGGIEVRCIASFTNISNSGARFERPPEFHLGQAWREWLARGSPPPGEPQ